MTAVLLLLLCAGIVQGAETKGKVTGDDVRIRSGPGKQFKVLGYLKKGDVVTLLGEKDEWRKIKTAKGLTGWMHSDFLDASGTAKNTDAKSAAGEGDFDGFFKRFLAAMKSKDKKTLRAMMAKDLRYTFGDPDLKDPVGAAFKEWDEMSSWSEIYEALSKGSLKSSEGDCPRYVAPPAYEKEPEYYGWRAIFDRIGGKWKCIVVVRGD